MQNQNICYQSLQAKKSTFALSIRNQSHKIKLSKLRQTYTLLTQSKHSKIIQNLPTSLNLICDQVRNDYTLQLQLIMKSQELATHIRQSNFQNWKLYCLLIGDLIIYQPNQSKKIISTCIQIILLKGIYFINDIPLFKVTIQDSINRMLNVIDTSVQYLSESTIQIIAKYLESILITIQNEGLYKSIEFQQFISIVGHFVTDAEHQNEKLSLFIQYFFDRIMILKFFTWLSYELEQIIMDEILKILVNITYLFHQPKQIKLIQPLHALCFIRFILVSEWSIKIKKLTVMLLNNILLLNPDYVCQAFDYGLIYLLVTLYQHFIGISEFQDEVIYTICTSIMSLKQNIQSQLYLNTFSQTQGLQIIFQHLKRDPTPDTKLMILRALCKLAISQKNNERLMKLINHYQNIIEQFIQSHNQEISNTSRELLELIVPI